MRSSHLAYGLLGILAASTLAAACGSGSDKKTARPDEGGAGGVAGATMNASGGGEFTPLAGSGGEAPSSGGVPNEAAGGAGGTPSETNGGGGGFGDGGAGGEPHTLPPLPVVNCDTITFKDPNLENVVRTAIDKVGPITPADVATLTNLDAVAANIVDLSGIECLTNLQSADFGASEGSNPIVSVAPLAYLSKLKTLDLSVTEVADLSPLAYLSELTDLSLDDLNLLPDVTALGQLPSLQTLSITGCAAIDKPESLAALRNISTLLATSTIDDASFIGGLIQLHHLELGYRALSNAEALGNLGNLNYLDAFDMGITSAAPFATLTELSHLNLYENPITSLLPLQNLTGLKELGLFAVTATSIKPLVDNQGLSNGDTVDLSNMPLVCATEKTNVDALVARGVTIAGTNPCP